MSGPGLRPASAPPPSGVPPAAAASSEATLSVVIPTHDTRELTLSCLASLAAARPAPTEVIVVDDGSRDGTADAVAASYPAVRLLRHQQPRGFTAAANAGAALARGDLLLLLNSDTEVAPDALAALHEAFAADPRLGVAGAALYYPDGRPQWSGGAAPTALWLLALASGVAFRLGAWAPWRRLRPVSGHGGRRSVAWVTGAALCIRREAWAAAGPLDPRFALYAQDLDLCLQARRLGWEVAVVPESRVVHHHGASVGGVAGVTGARHNPAMLWSDLVRAATKHRGPAGGRRTAALLRVGGAVRRGLLGLAALGGGEARRGAADERRLLREAAAAAATAAAHPRESLPAGAERSTTR